MDITPSTAFEAAQHGPGLGSGVGTEGSQENGAATAPAVKVDEQPKFDLESYISNYTGRTRFDRLYLIGTCSTFLSTEALKAAVIEAKSGKDVGRYERAVRALAEVAPNDSLAVLDNEWMSHTERVGKAETDRLDHELKGYKNNLIKESIRMGIEDLGRHHHETGDLAAASKAFSLMRDLCTTPSHIASMLFKIINVAIERGDWLTVQSSVRQLRNIQSKAEDQAKSQPKLSAALGLSQLHSGSYLEAANSFLATNPTLGDSYTEVLTSNDVAVYGGLCALATMDRAELQRRVLDNNSFRNFLELEPHIRRAISFFCNSKFRPCLEILEAYRADYLLDLHLQPHVGKLFSRIRTKSIEQYLVPFSRVTLDSMAKIFAPTIVGGHAHPSTDIKSPFVQELIRLIRDGTLDARIDLEKGVLVTKQTNLRVDVQKNALESLRAFNREAHHRLLRANVLHAGLEVRNVNERGSGESGGRRGMAAMMT